MKKLLLSLLFALVALTGLQAQTIWDGTADTEWYDETSTEFEISTAEQLAGLAELVNNGNDFSGKTILLTADIVLNDTSDWEDWERSAPANTWTPIGNSDNYFRGTFDGQGHTVSGIYINSSDYGYQGLFGYNSGTIKNVGLTNSYIKGDYYVGGVCGQNEGTISNCYNIGNVSGGSSVGGVCGMNYDQGTISNCYNSGTVNGNDYVGGVCGHNNGTISNCYNSGNVSGNDYNVGGVCGYNYGSVSNCYNSGNVSGNDYNVGGVCGENYGSVSNCYNSGNVSGNDYNVGGVCGENYGTISNCYNSGNVNGNRYIGGVCGYNYGSVSNCYYLQGTAEGGIEGSDVGGQAEVKTSKQFASGEVCWWLNGNSDQNPIWFQTLDTDAYPVWDNTHATVYAIGNCPNDINNTYSNQGPSQTGAHTDNDNNGRCDFCGKIIPQKPEQSDGIYQISNRAELYWFAGLVNGTLEGVEQNNSANAVLTADIVINENVLYSDGSLTENTNNLIVWSPIGYNSFYGTFDGQGHTISGIYIYSNNRTGIFYNNCGIIKNISVTDSYIMGGYYVGGICLVNYGTISNCYNSGNVNGNSYVGGVCGENYGTISNCHNSGTVHGNKNIGGVCGRNYNGTISNCYNSGTVNGNGSDTGGICGRNYDTISNCYNSGTVNGNGSDTGGICGRNFGGTISNCYNAGTVSGTGEGYTYVGGVCGHNRGTISNCYNSGTLSETDEYSYAGGVCGLNDGSISNCYTATGGINGNDVSGQAEVKTAEQFASGEVCWLLNGEQSEGAWGQKLDTDPCPVLGGPAVFKDGETYYNEEGSAIVETNSEQASFVIVSENLTIKIYGSDDEATVYNLAGNIVYQGSERIIPVPNPGMYMVRIGNEVQKTVVR